VFVRDRCVRGGVGVASLGAGPLFGGVGMRRRGVATCGWEVAVPVGVVVVAVWVWRRLSRLRWRAVGVSGDRSVPGLVPGGPRAVANWWDLEVLDAGYVAGALRCCRCDVLESPCAGCLEDPYG
jgi:hypothetical protein